MEVRRIGGADSRGRDHRDGQKERGDDLGALGASAGRSAGGFAAVHSQRHGRRGERELEVELELEFGRLSDRRRRT